MTIEFTKQQQQLSLTIKGNIESFDDESLKLSLLEAVQKHKFQTVSVNAEGLEKWDSTLVVVLYELEKECRRKKISVTYQNIPTNLSRLIELAFMVDRKPSKSQEDSLPFLEAVGNFGISLWQSINKGLDFISDSLSSIGRWFTAKAIMRKVDFLFALQDCSYKAVGIVSLVSFMVGLILAFVGAVQLKTFGAQVYVASLVAIGMTRIMGAIMVGVIMAGRTGASFAATLGTMQVNEEIDALKTMGIPTTDFLILPRLSALVLAMPFLTILADFAGILGGGFVGIVLLDIPAGEYWKYAWDAWSMTNFWVGVFHGFVFGFIIALCGCYYGVNSGRNADGVGVATTKAVVSSIVWMIVATGIITVIFERLGL